MEEIIRFYATYLAVPKDIEKFKTLGEYKEDQSSYDLETLRSLYKIKLHCIYIFHRLPQQHSHKIMYQFQMV